MRVNSFFLFLVFSVCSGLWLCSCSKKPQSSQRVVLNRNTIIYTSAQPGEPLYVAVAALQRDMEKVLGNTSTIKPLTAINEPGIVIIKANESKQVKPLVGWEAHRLYTATIHQQPQIIVQGADVRGTIYAIYTFSEKILGVPPLWYYSGWTPEKRNEIPVSALDVSYPSPSVRYRAWFPNDTDLFAPWRKLSDDNYALWLETAMRLKLNTIEWFDDERDYAVKNSISRTTKLINEYGLINTTHHHSPLNASFEGWEDYWKKTRNMAPPELSLANEKYLEEFWRYNVESVVRNHINMLWVLGFRGSGDHPFWFTFKDAPTSMQARGEVISRMLAKQRQIVLDVTGNPATQFRTIFYDELSDLLAKGYIHPPADDSTFIWTYVAARRDHFPNEDIQQLDKQKNLRLGYYFNYQFTSTGSHLAAGEGPWKMEDNYRYVASKTSKPLAFSVVNAGNIREFVMELSTNAAMMWDFNGYTTDSFLNKFCAQYYGSSAATEAVALYTKYYNAYWQQRKPDLAGFNRQFVFQDLRYKRAIQEIANAFNKGYTPNPLTDIPAEQLKGRTYRIIPEDNGATNQLDAVINGTTQSSAKFLAVAKSADALYNKIDEKGKTLFNDNLRQPAYYMYYLNESLLNISKAYKEENRPVREELLNKSLTALHNAEEALHKTQHGNFANWYAGDRIFGFQRVYQLFDSLVKTTK